MPDKLRDGGPARGTSGSATPRPGKHIAIHGNQVVLRGVRKSDAGFILALRTDNALNRYLSSTSGDVEQQRQWIAAYLKRPSEWYFVIEDRTGRPIGTVRIYDVKGDSFCWGSWILVRDAPGFAAIESALLVYEFAFSVLGFSASHFDVRKDNERVVAFHRRFGARDSGQDAENFFFQFSRADYESSRQRYARFLPAAWRIESLDPDPAA